MITTLRGVRLLLEKKKRAADTNGRSLSESLVTQSHKFLQKWETETLMRIETCTPRNLVDGMHELSLFHELLARDTIRHFNNPGIRIIEPNNNIENSDPNPHGYIRGSREGYYSEKPSQKVRPSDSFMQVWEKHCIE